MGGREQANHYDLRGPDTEVGYDATSITGARLLTYKGPRGDISFGSDEIEVLQTALGSEATVS